MSEVKQKKASNATKRIVSIVLFALSALLLITSIAGFVLRGLAGTQSRLNEMRTASVMHAASDGIVDSIAAEASAAKLKELRARADFRSLGMNEVKQECANAESAARAEAEALYANTLNADTSALIPKIDVLEKQLSIINAAADAELQAYGAMYEALHSSVTDWTDFVGELDDDALFASIVERVPAMGDAANAHLRDPFIRMARDAATDEMARDEKAQYDQVYGALCGLMTDWGTLADASGDDEALWAGLVGVMPELSEAEVFRDRLLKTARSNINAVASGGSIEPPAADEEIIDAEFVLNYMYFAQSESLQEITVTAEAAYDALWSELVKIIPDLTGLDNKMLDNIRDTIAIVVASGGVDFSTRYDIYASQKSDGILEGSDAMKMRLAASASVILIAGIALLLFALLYTFWKPISSKLGVPRAIITLFFIYLCLAAELYNINVPMMLGNVLVRVGMYGILVLAMLPGIQCGIGLNMGMTIGCISGLLATVIALQYDMTGATALAFSCVLGALIAIPLGWAYSLLLNRMKGNEMTISTYVGFSFVSLMCIGWMLLPFTNTKIIWLLCGRGLRVTHSLLGSFAHLLDNLLAFDLFGAKIPTGLLLFFLLCCGAMWLFSRSKTGIAMTAVGSNARFAEASGINVDRMRTIGTVLSTMLAAIGIVIYSQAFGYAQLYTAPRQLGFIAASAILIGGATVSKAKVGHVIIGVFLFEGVLALGQQIANAAVAGGGLSEVMRIMISNGIILYALTQSGGAQRG